MLALGQNSLSGNLKSIASTLTADMLSPPVMRLTVTLPTASLRQSSEMMAAPICDSSLTLTGVRSRSHGSTSSSVSCTTLPQELIAASSNNTDTNLKTFLFISVSIKTLELLFTITKFGRRENNK